MRTLGFRPRAARDVESIVTYIAYVLDAPNAAQKWYDELREAVELLCGQPEIGRVFDDDRLKVKGRRVLLVGKYRVFYSFDASSLVIWRVLHCSQDLDDHALIDF